MLHRSIERSREDSDEVNVVLNQRGVRQHKEARIELDQDEETTLGDMEPLSDVNNNSTRNAGELEGLYLLQIRRQFLEVVGPTLLTTVQLTRTRFATSPIDLLATFRARATPDRRKNSSSGSLKLLLSALEFSLALHVWRMSWVQRPQEVECYGEEFKSI
ncbi:hypothetical protein JCM5350_007379, partial [Sporobolomyces pararoseus]